jgi:hypothetical protein
VPDVILTALVLEAATASRSPVTLAVPSIIFLQHYLDNF